MTNGILAISKKKYVLKEYITRGEEKEFNRALYKDAEIEGGKSINRIKTLYNGLDQDDLFVKLFVKEFDGHDGITDDEILKLPSQDLKFLLQECDTLYKKKGDSPSKTEVQSNTTSKTKK